MLASFLMSKFYERKKVGKIVDKAYEDVGKPALKEFGGFFGAIAGFFNNVVAAPLHRLNAKFKVKTEAYIKNLYEKYQKIPDDNRQEPSLQIIGPTLESLKFNIDNNELSDLFTNLLLSSMDNRVSSKCHPAYVEIISQMDGTDARLLKGIFKYRGVHFAMVMPKCSININYQGRVLDGYSINNDKFPELHIGPIEDLSVFEISKSLYNLQRLGIIEINKLMAIRSDFVNPYEKLLNSNEMKEIYEKSCSKDFPFTQLKFDKGNITFTECGRDFAEIVIKN